jgi:hypothetical protein
MLFRNRMVLAAWSVVVLGAGSAGADTGAYIGPSSSQTPYVVPTADGVEVISLITVGDSPKHDGYRMVGVPDGLAAVAGYYDEKKGEFKEEKKYMTVFMNHELGNTSGTVRAHGQRGAFVSQWTINLDTLVVERGQDLIRKVMTWNGTGYSDTTGTTAFGRFCSGDLPGEKAFYDPRTRVGYDGLIYMNGEEVGNEGRSFAHVVSGAEKGTSYELPYLGKFSWENVVAHPYAGDKTIVVGLDDSTPGQVYVYIGEKRRDGNPVERAGLQYGRLYGVKVVDGGPNYGGAPVALESGGAISGRFVLEDVTDVASGTGAVLQSTSVTRRITEFARPEDGAWDTLDPKSFYFVTTGATVGGNAQTARLYKLTFDSLSDPSGGTIEPVVDSATLTGRDGATARSFDNITVDGKGFVLVQEDPGNSAYIAKTWKIDPAAASAVQLAESDRSRFLSGVPGFLTQDEESSGIIDVTHIVAGAKWAEPFRRYYLADMQAHYANGPELVEGGQLYLISIAESGHGSDRRDRKDCTWDYQ